MLWCMAVTSGTPKARALGIRLREAREATGLGVRELARRLDMSHATISNYEHGKRSPQVEDIASILAALGVTGQQRTDLLELAKHADTTHWISVQSGDRDRQMTALLDFERRATAIVDVAPLVIPGLLQTSAYARAIMTSAEVPPAEIETRVMVRVGRRDVIMRRNPATLHALIDETVIRRAIGGHDAQVEQLQHLLDVGAQPNVSLQVIPAAAGWNPSLDGPFVIIESAEGGEPSVVHLENQRSGLFFHETDVVESYRSAVERIRKMAMSPEATSELIAAVMKELETE